MPPRALMIVAFLMLCPSLAHVQTNERAGDKTYIRQAESDWAEPTVTNDIGVFERILADDFVGVDIRSAAGIRFPVGAPTRSGGGALDRVMPLEWQTTDRNQRKRDAGFKIPDLERSVPGHHISS